ncbi:MAG: RpiB/LacA/LacB family sugar-phosphate isomerase, partial [Prolixibacteraceae bacterium]|nr:RpiB/LacA/LacB family sugar-phosphate isomerase [Prolixibacteraceae bacterium]
ISSTDICATVNKIPGVFAALIKNTPAFFQEIESNDMAVKCLGGQIKGYALSSNKVLTFPNAVINTDIEFNQCLAKVNVLAKEINA